MELMNTSLWGILVGRQETILGKNQETILGQKLLFHHFIFRVSACTKLVKRNNFKTTNTLHSTTRFISLNKLIRPNSKKGTWLCLVVVQWLYSIHPPHQYLPGNTTSLFPHCGPNSTQQAVPKNLSQNPINLNLEKGSWLAPNSLIVRLYTAPNPMHH